MQPPEEGTGNPAIDVGREPAVEKEMPESPAPDTSEGADEEMGEYRSESTDEDADEGPLEDAGEAASEHADEAVSEDLPEETVETGDSSGESMPDYGEAASAETDGIAPDELEAEACLEDTIADDTAETEDLTDEKSGSRKLGGEKKIMAIVGAVVVALIVLIAVLMGTSGGGDDEIDVEAILGETQTIAMGSVSLEVPDSWEVYEEDGLCKASDEVSTMAVTIESGIEASDFYGEGSYNLSSWVSSKGAGVEMIGHNCNIGDAEIIQYRTNDDYAEDNGRDGYMRLVMTGGELYLITVDTESEVWLDSYETAQVILDTLLVIDPTAPDYTFDELSSSNDSEDTEYESTSEDSDDEEEEVEVEVEETCEIVSNLQTFDLFEETTVTGYGDDVIDVPVAGLPMLMTITNSGSSNFVIWTIDENGDEIDLLVNEIGSYSGTVTTYQDFGDVAMIEVQSSGSWSITFTPMGSMEELENGKEYTGDGVYYIDEDSLTKITASNSGDSNFVIWGVAMEDYDLLVNEIGDYSGTVVWAQPQSFLIVSSDGTWSVSW